MELLKQDVKNYLIQQLQDDVGLDNDINELHHYLINEVNELVKAGEKIISLLAGNNHPKASEGIETLYVAIVRAMHKGNFRTYEKTKFPKIKSDYMPRINQKPFDVVLGNIQKYKANI